MPECTLTFQGLFCCNRPTRMSAASPRYTLPPRMYARICSPMQMTLTSCAGAPNQIHSPANQPITKVSVFIFITATRKLLSPLHCAAETDPQAPWQWLCDTAPRTLLYPFPKKNDASYTQVYESTLQKCTDRITRIFSQGRWRNYSEGNGGTWRNDFTISEACDNPLTWLPLVGVPQLHINHIAHSQ